MIVACSLALRTLGTTVEVVGDKQKESNRSRPVPVYRQSGTNPHERVVGKSDM